MKDVPRFAVAGTDCVLGSANSTMRKGDPHDSRTATASWTLGDARLSGCCRGDFRLYARSGRGCFLKRRADSDAGRRPSYRSPSRESQYRNQLALLGAAERDGPRDDSRRFILGGCGQRLRFARNVHISIPCVRSGNDATRSSLRAALGRRRAGHLHLDRVRHLIKATWGQGINQAPATRIRFGGPSRNGWLNFTA